MFYIFGEEKGIALVMMMTLVLSIFSRIMIGILYQNMIKETENMSSTSNKLLKQCKLKFTNCYQLNHGVPNISIFVDKFLNRITIGPFRLQTIYHISGQLMIFSVFAAGIGICKSIIKGRLISHILPFYIVSFLGLYLYFSISAFVDLRGRKRTLKINLIDYLENHMVNRLKEVQKDEKFLNGQRHKKEENTIEKETYSSVFTRNEEKELEELLKEFLV